MAFHRLASVAILAGNFGLSACGSSADSSALRPMDAGGADVGVDGNPSGSCVVAAPAPGDWRLHADGTALRDALGRVVFLHGVDAGGRSKFSPYVPFDYASGQFSTALGEYMDRAASWGIDVLRLPFTWAALEPVQGQQDADWLSRYQQLVDAAWARGLWVVVEFHQDVYSECFCGDGFPSWTVPNAPAPHHDCSSWSLEYFSDSAVQHAFDAFWAAGSSVMPEYLAAWDTMIARFKDEPGVVGFEPINEPAPGTATIATFEATTLTTFYTQMTARMNQAAPKSLVFVNPVYLDGAGLSTKLVRPGGDGVVFAPHFYPLGVTTATVLADVQKWSSVGAAWNVPVFVGEFGEPNTTMGIVDYITACFGALDTLGLSGAEWEYSVASEVWNSEAYGVVAADGTEYPVAQALVRPFARAVAGSDIEQSWTASSRTFTLSYTPTGGTTELQFPSRAYPKGWTVSIAGGCYDAKSVPGRMLVQPEPGAKQVSLRITAP